MLQLNVNAFSYHERRQQSTLDPAILFLENEQLLRVSYRLSQVFNTCHPPPGKDFFWRNAELIDGCPLQINNKRIYMNNSCSTHGIAIQ
jgi:hypothetical protein